MRYTGDEDWYPRLGTVRSVSPAGYVRVNWDYEFEVLEDYFTPSGARERLQVVTGEEAKRRHDWHFFTPDGMVIDAWEPLPVARQIRCLRCGVVQTEENGGASCAVS